MTQLAITAALVVAIMLLVVLPLAALMIRRRKPELERARTAPFTYGVAPALMAGDVQRLHAVHKLGISAPMRPGSDVNARIGELVQPAELVVRTTRIPLHQGPPATYGSGAPCTPQ